MRKLFLYSLFFIFYFLFSVHPVRAEDYRANYQVQYFLSENAHVLSTKVQFSIQIVNLRSDVYVSKFSISFPKNFVIKDLKVFDDRREITPVVVVDASKTKIDLAFSEPNTGRDSVNTFHLQFSQENLFQVNGNVWEVILPTIENKGDGSYKIIVNLPQNADKKISIAKPKPTLVRGGQIIWDNPSTRTVYAVFGDSQVYALKLNYHLVNPKLYPAYTDIAFPPDTLHQKIFVDSIDPKPESVYVDEDGNYLGRYFLRPKETLPVVFIGKAEVTVKPRDEVIPVIRRLLANQQNYLLTDKKYWKVSKLPEPLDSSSAIYRYVVNFLRYDYNKALTKNNRLGASGALQYPNNSVCVEFSDLFIAFSREKGIYSREIEGYGFSKDPQLRPLSLVSDVLHSWPEFYDKASELWIQVDPTWENTSGIDYFSSFDLNHIAFAIHGKESDYPLPAGMYKVENSRDVMVNAIMSGQKEVRNLKVLAENVPSKLSDRSIVKTKITFVNNGNVYLWNVPVKIDSDILSIEKNQFTIPLIAPLETKDFIVTLGSLYKNKQANGSIDIIALNKNLFSKPIVVIPYTYDLALKISAGVAILLFFILLAKIYSLRRRKHD